ncbi:MAG: hypothetical protein HKN27_02075 [Silicimonas sp.]|nr:hypothetical protein [Silicimonas sp.]
MRYHLGPTLIVGGRQVAVISQIQTRNRHFGHSVFFHGGKRPVFVLVKDGAAHAAFDMSGARVAPSDIDAQCPKLAGRFFDKS